MECLFVDSRRENFLETFEKKMKEKQIQLKESGSYRSWTSLIRRDVFFPFLCLLGLNIFLLKSCSS